MSGTPLRLQHLRSNAFIYEENRKVLDQLLNALKEL